MNDNIIEAMYTNIHATIRLNKMEHEPMKEL